MEILVIGAGFVGVTTAVTFAELGHKVTCVDTDREKIKSLKAGQPYFYEPNLELMVAKHLKTLNIKFSARVGQAIQQSSVIFICVGTPTTESGDADLQYVMQASETIGRYLNGHKIIVVKSTVPIGACMNVKECIKRASHEKWTFDVVSNPEFLREGNALTDSLHPHRVVIGIDSQAAARVLEDLYKPMNCHVILTTPHTAELIKYASNSFLATKISYINQLARMCEAFHVNVRDVALGMGLDPRIGSEFLDAGVGYGGSCFPKDVRALLAMADACGVNLSILKEVQHVNETQHAWFLDKIRRQLGSLNGRVVAILGLAFKPNTSDTRESPALSIIQSLIEEGAIIKVHDPVAKLPSWAQNDTVKQCGTAEETADEADALLLCTDWPQYKTNVDWHHVKSKMRHPNIFDGRNILDGHFMHSTGFSYQGIGYP